MERPCDRSGRLGSFGRARSTAFAVMRAVVMSAAGLGLLCLAGAHPAGAAVTGTGGGPESTVTAPHTSSSGQTLPPGAAGAPILDPDKRTERQKKLDRVLNGICKGC